MDDELLARWRAGERDAGQALFARHFSSIYRFFSSKCDDPDELVQATFFACVRARDQFRQQSSFRTYLFAIARNELQRHLRDLVRDRPLDLEVSSIADLVTTPVTRLARDAEHAQLLEALRRLPVAQQTLLELHYWEELDAEALGEVFGVSGPAIRVRLHRARHALRDALGAGSVEGVDTLARSIGGPDVPAAGKLTGTR
jgi:RNA polymerase sigma factor (sigma-70 family)